MNTESRTATTFPQSAVAACCVNSAAMLQLADQDGHAPDKTKRFRDLNEKQARALFAAAGIADEMLAALQLVARDGHSGALPTNIQNAVLGAIIKATGGTVAR